MRVNFQHFYGDHTHFDIQLCKPILHLDNSKEYEALENGWSIYNNKWYQMRSVRLDLNNYISKLKQIKDHTIEYIDKFELSDQHFKVYQDFVNTRNFKHAFKIDVDMDRASQVLIKKDNQVVAFTKMIKYDGGIESQFTVWDYKEPKLSIGKKIIDYEVEYTKSLGFKYLYIGPGYDNSSVYKSNFQGFEWWTGQEWSTDKNKYIELCKRDSSIQTLEDLSKIYND